MKKPIIYIGIIVAIFSLALVFLLLNRAAERYCLTGAFLSDMPSKTEIKTFEIDYGKKPYLVTVFKDWSGTIESEVIDDVYSSGCALMVTWEPWYAMTKEGIEIDKLLSGGYDEYIESFGQALTRAPGPLFLRFAHEMNGDWYPWSGKKIGRERYIASYRYVKDRLDTIGIKGIQWVFSVNWEDLPRDGNHFLMYYPGDSYVDYIGIDGYNWGDTQDWSRWISFREIFFNRYLEATRKTDKPVMITEFGCAERGGDRASWIREAFRSMKKMAKLKAFVLFNVDKEAKWRIDPKKKEGEALRDLLRDRYFKDKI